jgi:hypothetical protein
MSLREIEIGRFLVLCGAFNYLVNYVWRENVEINRNQFLSNQLIWYRVAFLASYGALQLKLSERFLT